MTNATGKTSLKDLKALIQKMVKKPDKSQRGILAEQLALNVRKEKKSA